MEAIERELPAWLTGVGRPPPIGSERRKGACRQASIARSSWAVELRRLEWISKPSSMQSLAAIAAGLD